MPIDARELGLEAVFYAFLGVLVGIQLAGLVVAAAASVLGGRRFGLGSFGMGLVVVIAAAVDAVVIWRTVGGEVTGWDLVWAAGLTMAGFWSLRRLGQPPHPPTDGTR
jgi:hypothetical protein